MPCPRSDAADVCAEVINAIGEPDFAAHAAEAVRRFAGFELTAVLDHHAGKARVVFDNFDAAGRRGLAAYARHTHRINPMLARAPSRAVVRARDFAGAAARFDADMSSLLTPAPDEELGFRTVGWPPRLEEIGLYFESNGSRVELGLYRERGPRAVPGGTLAALQRLLAPLAAAFQRHAALGARSARLAALSPREREVCDLMLLGCSNEAIGLRMGISPHTVKDHRKQVYRKLGVGSLQQLFARAH